MSDTEEEHFKFWTWTLVEEDISQNYFLTLRTRYCKPGLFLKDWEIGLVAPSVVNNHTSLCRWTITLFFFCRSQARALLNIIEGQYFKEILDFEAKGGKVRRAFYSTCCSKDLHKIEDNLKKSVRLKIFLEKASSVQFSSVQFSSV